MLTFECCIPVERKHKKILCFSAIIAGASSGGSQERCTGHVMYTYLHNMTSTCINSVPSPVTKLSLMQCAKILGQRMSKMHKHGKVGHTWHVPHPSSRLWSAFDQT